MWINNFFPWFTGTDRMNKKLNKYENDMEFQNVFINLVNLASYAFEWRGLPDTCNERFLELCLLLEGRACIVNDPAYGFLSLKAGLDGSRMNMYGEFSGIYGYGWNGFNNHYTAYMPGSDNKDCQAVLCRDNTLAYPYYYYIIMYAKRLTDSMRSIDVATKKLKVPYFITCAESQYNSVKKILDDVENNKDSIIASNSTMPDMFKVLPTNVNTALLDTLWNSYNNYDGIIKTILGIETATNKDKSERLLVDEVNSESTISNINVLMRLKCREKFCNEVNSIFGLNISVKLRDEMLTEKGGYDETRDTIGDNPGNIETII